MGDIGAGTFAAQNGAAGGGGGPLGGGGSLIAVWNGHPVLPLGGTEVRGGEGGGPVGVPPINQQGRKRKTLTHGGAGTVQAVEGDVEVPQTEGGADALIQQITRQNIIQLGGRQMGLVQCPLQYPLLHGGFSLFPSFFAEKWVTAQLVEIGGQRAGTFQLAADVGKGQDGWRLRQGDGSAADAFWIQWNHAPLDKVCPLLQKISAVSRAQHS